MKYFKHTLLFVAFYTLAITHQVLAIETDGRVRDPSTIVKKDRTYWVYGTGPSIQQFSSTDRIHWTNRGPVFPAAPQWVAEAVPANKDGIFWAPDVRLLNGKYHLYYSISTIGSKISAIGLATNATLDPKAWIDQGVVVQTTAQDDYNAIDPCIFQDAQGTPWLVFGSYFSGIKLIQIDIKTGKRQANTNLYHLATRPGVGNNPIEAAAVYYRDGYYYLFINWDGCCAGSKSTYNIRIGRSKTVTGPYLDKSGKDLNNGGGTLFLSAVHDNGTGRPFDDQTGPGHVGILQDTDGYWVSTHYEWARAKNGATTMYINKVDWDADGWPRVILDPGPFKIVSNLSTHAIVEVAGGATRDGSALQTAPYEGGIHQKWRLNYQGNGYYSIISAASNKALGVAGCSSQPGAKMEIAPFQRRDCQLWYLQQNDDGTYFLLTKNSNKVQALDVPGCSLNDGVQLHQWNANGLDCQKWSFRVR